MKKISTLLYKDPQDLGRVTTELSPELALILSELDFYLKIDGTSCLVLNGILYVRYDAKLFQKKRGKLITFTREEVLAKLPEGAIACQEPDEKSGHWPHWIPASSDSQQYHAQLEAFAKQKIWVDGTYECVGLKVNSNRHSEEEHYLIPHKGEKVKTNIQLQKGMTGQEVYDFFFNLFSNEFHWEGLVAYHLGAPIAKIRLSDFGLKAPYDKASSLI